MQPVWISLDCWANQVSIDLIRSHVHKFRKAIRAIGLNGVTKAQFIPVVAATVILDPNHMNCRVEALCVAQ